MNNTMSIVLGLQNVLDSIIFAIEQEENGNLLTALHSYTDARNQMVDIRDYFCTQSNELVGGTCSILLETYEARIQKLKHVCFGEEGMTLNEVDKEDARPESNAALPLVPLARDAPVSEQESTCHASHVELDTSEGHTLMTYEQQDTLPQQPSKLTSEVISSCARNVAGSLEDVAGLGDVKDDIRQAVFLPLHYPHFFTGIRQPPRSFLLHGPPGTGKTMLVEKLCAEAGMKLLVVSPSAVLSKWSGESEKMIRMVFEAATSLQPCAIFLDEVDSMAPQRKGSDDLTARRLLTELLIQMSAAAERQASVYIFAATNRIQDCDEAILRRFDRRIHVPLPGADDRAEQLRLMLARPEMEHDLTDQHVAALASLTDGYSSSDIAVLLREAAMEPVREIMQAMRGQRSGSLPISMMRSQQTQGMVPQVTCMRKLTWADFTRALTRVKPTDQDKKEHARGEGIG